MPDRKDNPLGGLTRKPGTAPRADVEATADRAAEEPTKRLNANVPESLHRRVKLEATRRGVTITDLLVDLLEANLPE